MSTEPQTALRMTFQTPASAKDPIAYWADCVTRSYRAGIEQFVVTGHALEHAVADFKKRDDKHWKHAYGELLRRVKMSRQTASQLRSIAKHSVLSDRRNYHALPANWTTLRQLARLPESEVKRRIADGEITPQTGRKEADAWVASNRYHGSGSPAIKAKQPAQSYRSSSAPARPEGMDGPAALDKAHALYLNLDGEMFIAEIVNLIADHPTVSVADVIQALEAQL